MPKPGLYFCLKNGSHTYGIEAVNSSWAYTQLKNYFHRFNAGDHDNKLFLQGDSMNGIQSGLENERDMSWLFVEFLGYSDNEDECMAIAEMIANNIDIPLMGII
jgi:hypothetical protein